MLKIAEHPREGAPMPALIGLGDLEIDLERRTVRRGSRSLPVKARSFELLQYLIRRYPETARHREILACVWPDVVVSTDALTQRVKLLRKALGDTLDIECYIASIHGQGYRLSMAPHEAPLAGKAQHHVELPQRRPLMRRAWAIAASAVLLLGTLVIVWPSESVTHTIKHALRHH